MKDILQISKALVKKGDQYIRDHGMRNFHVKAAELLEKGNLHKVYDYQQLVAASFNPDFSRTPQNFSSTDFSDLPVTIARGQECFIDIYFWRRRPTVIHNHHFSGAFQCLQGSNVDLEFTFRKTKELGRYHSLGEIRLHETHVIKAGDIQTIAPLDKFIHQNHHHADLTVNLCFRTPDLSKGCISNYLYSGLCYEKNPKLLARFDRLYRFLRLEPFDFKKLQLDLDDALFFLLQTEASNSQNQQFLKLRQHFAKQVQKEAKLDISEMLKQHEQELDKLEDQYE